MMKGKIISFIFTFHVPTVIHLLCDGQYVY